MIRHLILSGGGNKCLVFIGALKFLEEQGLLLSIEKFAGTSGGSIIILLVVLGYTIKDIIDLYKQLDLYALLNINSNNILNFFNNFGLDNGDKVIRMLKIVLRKKNFHDTITFEELYAITNKHLLISGTCVEKERVEYFDHILTPDMPVYLAVRISISIPFIFNRVIYKGFSYIDGGFLEYFPLHCFKDNEHTLALGIKNKSLNDTKPIQSIESYVYKLMCGLYRIHQDNLIRTCTRNIIIYDIDITGLQDILDITKKIQIIQNGYETTNDYFSKLYIQQALHSIIDTIEREHKDGL